jgi:DNA-binding MarR family transcriptional regulator
MKDRALAAVRLFNETGALSHQLRALAADLHGYGSQSAGRRGILRSLDRLGPQTVPQLARARPVSRQRIQFIVNALLKQRLVAAGPNPAHRRSSLLHLTAKGKDQLESIQRREQALLASAPIPLTADELDRAASVLRSLCAFLESKEWKSHVAKRA